MAYRLTYSDYAGNTASPSPPAPTPAPTGNGYRLKYSDYPGTVEGPPDPARWEGPPGPAGPPGPTGPAGPGYTLPTASTTLLGGVKIDGSSITISDGVISSAATSGGPFLPLSGGTVTGTITVPTIAGSPDLNVSPAFNGRYYSAIGRTYPTATAEVARYDYGIHGAVASGQQPFVEYHVINSDTVDASQAQGGGMAAFSYVDALAAGAVGGRSVFGATLNQNGATTSATGQFYVAGAFWANASYSAGGAAGAGNQRGNLFASNDSAYLKAGAGLYWNTIVGYELDIGVEAGVGVNRKQGMKIVTWAADRVSGATGTDYAYGITAQSTCAGWDVGYCIGSPDGWWPMKTTSALIGTVAPFSGGPAYAAAWGIDFNAVAFSGGTIRGPGFSVNGSGDIAGRNITATGTASGAAFTTLLAPYAPLASPTFTGTPTLPTGTIAVTQAPGTSNTTPATTAFVGAAVTAGTYTLPTASTTVLGGVKIDGTTVTIAAGVITVPTDTSRYAASNPSGYQTAANVTTALAAGQPGAFSTLSASSTVSGVGFSTYLASPPAIGSTTPSTGKFTTVQSTIVTGTAPLTVASTTNVANLNASSLNGATFAAPGAIGGTTAAAGSFTTLSATSTTTLAAMTSTGITASPISGSTGSFTTLAASSTVSGTGFSTYLASPPAIGATAASTGAFTTLSASSTVSGTGFSTYLASPPAIGGTAAAAGAFTTLSASSTVSGTGFSTYLASPPAIGGTAAAAGTFTTVTSSAGVHFGSVLSSANTDLTKHLDLYGGQSGMNMLPNGHLNLQVPAANAVEFYNGSTFIGAVTATGLNYMAIGVTSAAAGTFTTLAASAQILSLPAAKTGTAYTVAATDRSLILAPTGTFTLTLPTASTSTGRILVLKLTAAFAVNSASANVVPMVGGSAVAAILVATAGKYAELQSDGTNWQIMSAN